MIIVFKFSVNTKPFYTQAMIYTSNKCTKCFTNAKKSENPITNKLRVEFKSTNCRLDNPTAVIIPNMIHRTPPTIGVGIVEKRAPTLFNMPMIIIKHPANCTTRLLPT